MLKVEGISFSVPQRKKFNLIVTTAGISAVAPTGGDKVEFGVEWDNVGEFCYFPGGAMDCKACCLLLAACDFMKLPSQRGF